MRSTTASAWSRSFCIAVVVSSVVSGADWRGSSVGVVAMEFSQRWERRSVARIANGRPAGSGDLWDKPAAAGKTLPTTVGHSEYHPGSAPDRPAPAAAPACTTPMSIVQLALKRPYTFIVMAMLIVLATPFALLNMATDIFPEINIPVISIIWNYNGLPATEMGQRIAAQNERSLTTTVSDIEHIESTSLAGISIIKVFFQPNANIQTALA